MKQTRRCLSKIAKKEAALLRQPLHLKSSLNDFYFPERSYLQQPGSLS